MTTLQSFKDALARSIYDLTTTEAIEQGICIGCKLPAKPRCYSSLGYKEYRISGLCETCFDNITLPEEKPSKGETS